MYATFDRFVWLKRMLVSLRVMPDLLLIGWSVLRESVRLARPLALSSVCFASAHDCESARHARPHVGT